MGAEFLYQEYKDNSPWLWITGYSVATGTGFFRLYNNRHWLNDICAGAGIGILSTKISYWLFSEKFSKRTSISLSNTQDLKSIHFNINF